MLRCRPSSAGKGVHGLGRERMHREPPSRQTTALSAAACDSSLSILAEHSDVQTTPGANSVTGGITKRSPVATLLGAWPLRRIPQRKRSPARNANTLPRGPVRCCLAGACARALSRRDSTAPDLVLVRLPDSFLTTGGSFGCSPNRRRAAGFSRAPSRCHRPGSRRRCGESGSDRSTHPPQVGGGSC